MHMASYAVYSSSDNIALKTTSGFIKGIYEKYKTENDKTTARFKPSDVQVLRQTVREHRHAELHIPICMSAKL